MQKFFEFTSRIPLTLALLGMVVVAFVAYVVGEKRIDTANGQRQASIFLAEELRQSSDDLTRMVRTYAATGNPIYKRHFQEILDIRDGRKPRPVNYQTVYWGLVGLNDERPQPSAEAIPLLTLMRQAGFTDLEFAKLAEAKASSDELTQTEFAAMALLEETQPPTPSNRERAIEMLHDVNYHEAKARIMGSIADFYTMVDRRTLMAVHAAENRAHFLRFVFMLFAALLALQLLIVRRREALILGGSIERVHAEIGALGSVGVSRSELAGWRRDSSVLDAVALTRAKLAQLNAERKRNEESLLLYAKMFEHSGEAIMITDAGNRIVAVNAAFTHLTGYELDEVRGENPRILASQHTPTETYRAMWAALRESGHWQGELWDRAKDGHVYPKWTSISLIRSLAGEVTHHVASFMDISERKAAEERISRLAHHDPLTGLFNRYSLYERLEQALLTAQREGGETVVMFIDMDRFKSINDTLGHQAGDALLIEVAQRLRGSVRESDIVARLGGDEFVVVLTGVESGMLAGASISGKILHRLAQPYAYKDKLLHSTPSIGLSIYPTDGDNVETLMKHADLAMYSAKEHGKNTFQFFSPAMNADAIERMLIEQELRVALERNQFELHYQPQIRTVDGGIWGLEALVRWRHPKDGMISPMKFIPITEEIGLIEELGAWVLNEACRQFVTWQSAGIRAGRIAVNLSANQLRSTGLVELVRKTMSLHGIGAGELELEVTESVAMEDPQRAIAQLAALRELGVELAIDDFGTGYSSLAYLKLLPIQTLKLDRAFVKDIEIDENDAAISTATIALAHSLGLKVVAEGVETEAQRGFLASHRCDILQGYLFSKPLPADEAEAFLRAS